MDKAVALIEGWCRGRPIEGMQLEVVRLEGRTPVILMEIPGQSDDTVLLYGHLDKQPEMVGWLDHLGPWKPVIEGERLYGRGGADDGYAAFASLTAIEALQKQKVPHARCVVLIEACEESGSFDLPLLRRSPFRSASARPAWSCASTRAAATTTSCGARPPCAASSPVT